MMAGLGETVTYVVIVDDLRLDFSGTVTDRNVCPTSILLRIARVDGFRFLKEISSIDDVIQLCVPTATRKFFNHLL